RGCLVARGCPSAWRMSTKWALEGYRWVTRGGEAGDPASGPDGTAPGGIGGRRLSAAGGDAGGAGTGGGERGLWPPARAGDGDRLCIPTHGCLFRVASGL